ncbi:hypothetical protein O9993_01685 [Vibrio lentus]|nr:hypothetical protein [Vibrio lentus]
MELSVENPTLIAVGTKMPKWVEEGFQEYRRRFPHDMPLEAH